MFLLRSLLPIEQEEEEEEVLRPESALPRRAPTAAPAGGEEEVAENIIFEARRCAETDTREGGEK